MTERPNDLNMTCLLVGGTESEVQMRLGTIVKPAPGPAEVLIQVRAAGVVPTELHWYPTWHTKTGEKRVDAVPGHEFSGTVAALGEDVGGFQLGDEVFGMNDWYSDGAMAAYCLARWLDISMKPQRLTHLEAASVPISALTAWQGLFDHARLQSGDSVLVHGAAGSVGAFVVQLAKRHGARVTATASAQDREFVQSLGAESVIDYRSTPFETVVQDMDVVFDTVGGDTLERSWNVLREGGRLVTVAYDAVDGSSDQRLKQAAFIVNPDREQLDAVASLLDGGTLRTFVSSTVTLDQAADAYRGILERRGRGKVVVSAGDISELP